MVIDVQWQLLCWLRQCSISLWMSTVFLLKKNFLWQTCLLNLPHWKCSNSNYYNHMYSCFLSYFLTLNDYSIWSKKRSLYIFQFESEMSCKLGKSGTRVRLCSPTNSALLFKRISSTISQSEATAYCEAISWAFPMTSTYCKCVWFAVELYLCLPLMKNSHISHIQADMRREGKKAGQLVTSSTSTQT